MSKTRNPKYKICDPYIIDIAKWIDEGITFGEMARRISSAENTNVTLNMVYHFALKKGLDIHKNSSPKVKLSDSRGCQFCADAKTCRRIKCSYNDEELNLFRTLIEV